MPQKEPKNRPDPWGITVELTNDIIRDEEDGKTAGALIVDDHHILVCARYGLDIRRRAVSYCRQVIIESLPEEEMAALEADISEAARRLRQPVPPGMPADGYTLVEHPGPKPWVCPICTRPYKKDERLWDHLRHVHEMECWDGRWMTRDMHEEAGIRYLENLKQQYREKEVDDGDE